MIFQYHLRTDIGIGAHKFIAVLLLDKERIIAQLDKRAEVE
jgi:hypothetical protein